MRRPLRVAVAAVLLAAVLGVAGCRDAADKPFEPVWGKQPCDHCAMLLDEPRFAAQAATPDGNHIYFDDVGCLVAWLREHSTAQARAWVRRKEQWVDAGAARYLAGQRTPMGYGYVASTSGIDFSELQRRLAAVAEEHAHAQ